MEDSEVKVGSLVRFFSSRALAKVLEIDREYQAARCKLIDGVGGECWQRLDGLEIAHLKTRKYRIGFEVGVRQW